MDAASTRPGVEAGKSALETGALGCVLGQRSWWPGPQRAVGGSKEDADGDGWPVTFSGTWEAGRSKLWFSKKTRALCTRLLGVRGGEGEGEAEGGGKEAAWCPRPTARHLTPAQL